MEMIDRKQQAIERGAEAYRYGIPLDKNPYFSLGSLGKSLAPWWDKGWVQEMELRGVDTKQNGMI